MHEAVNASPLWAPLLVRAIEESDGRWTWEQCCKDILTGALEVWTVESGDRLLAVYTTRLLKSRERFVLVEDMAGDDMREWLPAVAAALEDYAKDAGATQIVAEGRRGWEKVLREYGYRPARFQVVKKLKERMQ